MKHVLCLGFLALLATSSQAQEPTVYHVRVHTVDTQASMIDPGIAAFVGRSVKEAEAAGASAIVFEIDTFGGRVDAATLIRDAIINTKLLTIAFINKRAISAGALISLSCDKIVMARGGSIGAATAVEGGTGKKASDKVISYFRAEMRATAERTGRDPKMAEAMVDERVDLPGFSSEVGRPATLTTEQALHYQIADETAETLYEVLRIYDLEEARVVELESNWAERAVRFLTHPIITSLLLAIAMFGIIAEVRTPGWGLGGTLALVALTLFFGSHYIVKLAEWDELLLFVVGLVLLGIELFAIPGFGVVGLAGILAMVASLVLSQLGAFPLWSLEEVSSVVGRLALSMIAAIVGSVALLRALPRFAAFNRLILNSEMPASEGYVSSSSERDSELVGKEGVALTTLRPAGVGLFEGERRNVVAEGSFIEAQARIKILKARGSRIVVRQV